MGKTFDDELKRLRSHFMAMGIDASEQIYQVTKAFTEHDYYLAQRVLHNDNRINDEAVKLDKQAFKMMALQQPVAADFRKIISILKGSSDIERLGDYAVHIAQSMVKLGEAENSQKSEPEIAKMMMLVRQMLERILDAYVYTDEQAAYEVANMDFQIDLLYVQQQKSIISAMMQNQKIIKVYENYLAVIRNLERSGDHIVNLAEWIIYSATGRIVELNPGKTDPQLVQRRLQAQHNED